MDSFDYFGFILCNLFSDFMTNLDLWIEVFKEFMKEILPNDKKD